MKKILLILGLVSLSFTISFSNPPNGFTSDPYPWYMEDFPPVDRDIPPYTPACSCACEDMVKSAEIKYGQLDSELYLRGGYIESTSLNCQEFRLLLRACNGQPITHFVMTFDYENAELNTDCFDVNQVFYRVDGNNNPIKLEDIIDRPSENSIDMLLGDDYVPACSSKVIKFYVCTSVMCQFPRVNVSFNLFDAAGCTSRVLIFQYDGIVGGVPQEVNINQSETKLKLIDVIEKYQIRVFDMYGNEVAILNNIKNKEIESSLVDLGLKNGLYLLQKLNYDQKVTTDKIFINR